MIILAFGINTWRGRWSQNRYRLLYRIKPVIVSSLLNCNVSDNADRGTEEYAFEYICKTFRRNASLSFSIREETVELNEHSQENAIALECSFCHKYFPIVQTADNSVSISNTKQNFINKEKNISLWWFFCSHTSTEENHVLDNSGCHFKPQKQPKESKIPRGTFSEMSSLY